MCRHEKNTILPLRLVCRAFDTALKPYLFKTIQLRFSHFLKSDSAYRVGRGLDFENLNSVGLLTEALYLDLMVVRDPEEIERLDNAFHGMVDRLPEMVPLIGGLWRYCMGTASFDERDFRGLLEKVLEWTPNLHRVKLNLPFQVLGRKSRTATLLFATTLECLAKRRVEHKSLKTLVVDHLSDTSLINICNNPMDLANAIKVFTSILELCISIKRQEFLANRQDAFSRHLWLLISKSRTLQSLCLVGWNVKKYRGTTRHLRSASQSMWNLLSLPFYGGESCWEHLRYLELKRVDIEPLKFLGLIKQIRTSIKEVYLVEIYLKVRRLPDDSISGLWIGQYDTTKSEGSIWLAQELRNMEGLRLNILRATGLGYDEFAPVPVSVYLDLDLPDPLELDRSFDQRFVDAVILGPDKVHYALDIDSNPNSQNENHENFNLTKRNIILSTPSNSLVKKSYKSNPRTQKDYDAETYQRFRNTTSYFKSCIDGWFFNHNEQAIRELQGIITFADTGMILLSEEIYRARNEGRQIQEPNSD